jgi:hypothetical protein|tara:strand:- start:7842 stop:8165 length:324 start_codon:yes stop_codon:yes gene_type:complete
MHYYISKNSFKSTIGIDSIVELNQDQARRRAHAIESLGNNLYKVLKRIHFKAGEIFGIKEELRYTGDLFVKKSEPKEEECAPCDPEPKPKPKSVKKSKTKKVFGSRR